MDRKLVKTVMMCGAAWVAPTTGVILFPSVAQAQTICVLGLGGLLECVDGVTPTVTGTVTGGTVLIPGPGLTATSATDLVANVTGNITTTGDNEPGVLLVAADDLIFTMDGTVTTLGDNSDGVNLTGTTVVADLGDVFTSGLDSDGVEILATGGGIDLDVDVVETEGDLSSATILRGSGDINLTADALSTNGIDAIAMDISVDPAVCVTLAPGECDITAAAESVTTNGFGGIGALIVAAGDTDVTIGVLETNGDQAAGLDLSADPTACVILGEGACDTAFTVGSLTTNGDDSPGALVYAIGDIDATVGVLETNGDRSVGLDLTSDPTACAILGAGACDTSFTVGTLTTEGAGATGILVRAAGDTTGSVNILETNGDGATGIDIASDPTACVIVGVGACDVGITANEVTTNGNQAAAVLINTVGDITADLGLINTSGDESPGVRLIVNPTLCAAIGPGTCVINATIDDVDTDGDDSPGVEVDGGEDPVVVVVDDVDTDGDNSPGVDVEATGPIDVTTGDVNTGGNTSPGIIVDGADDPVNVTCGNVVTTGPNSPGVDVEAQGAITVNCLSVTTAGINSDGIQITGDTGPVSVTVGPVVTTGADSDGIDVTTSTGSQTIVAGGVNVSGPGSDGISAVATGCANININATNDIVSAQGTAILASTLCAVNITTQPGASVTGAVAGIDATSGTGTTITLNDSVRATAGPAIDVDGAAALINVNTGGSIIGRIDLTANNDVLNNGGLFDVIGTSDFGAGVDVINNLAGGTVRSTAGAGVLANCETFNNAGTITMIDGAANDTLTICGNYVGTGNANLGLDVGGGAGGLTADRLIIVGNASGATGVNFVLLPGSGIIDTDGVLVVDTGTSTTNAFTLRTINNTSPLLAYALEQRSADYFLTSAPTLAAFEPLSLAAAATDMWYQSADEVISQTRLPHSPDGFAVWGQIYASRDRTGNNSDTQTINGIDYDVNTRSRNHRRGVQAGVDFGFGGGRVGLTGGYAKNKVSSAADLRIKGWNLGLYGQFGGAVGFHGEGLFKFDRYKINVNDGAFAGNHSRLRETGVDGALGYRMGMGGASVDLNAGLSHVRSKLGGIEAFGFSYDYDKITSTRGRAGVRAVFGEGLRPYADATVLHEFNGKANVTLFDGVNDYDLDYSGKGTWLRLEAGIGGPYAGAGPILAAWADFGEKKGIGARLGFRFGGAREAMAPPPPPPPPPAAPPPPPPATQTCSDGSVILATDVCPLPPPPPPPPAPEPERG